MVCRWQTAGDHERLLRRSETPKMILGHAAALEKGVWRVRVGCRRPENKNLFIASGCIWTPPVLQAFHSIKLKVRLHTYIRPVIELKGSGHNGLFARLLLIAFTCSMAQQPLQGLQTPVRPVAISCVASQSVWISPLSVSQWFSSQSVCA
jgi:hypothetical protein